MATTASRALGGDPAPASIIDSGAGRDRTVLLALLSLTFFLCYFDRLLMVVVGQMVKAEFGLSDKALFLLTGAAFIVIYGLCGIGAGWLVDKYSRKKILAWSLGVWSLLTMACGLANSFVQLAIARAGVGVGEAAAVPAGTSLISDMFPPAKRPLAIAIFYAGGMVGVLCTFLIGTWIAVHYGWRMAFVASGPPGILLAIAIAFIGREPTREKRILADGEVERDAGDSSFLLIWRNKPLVMVLFASSIATYGNVGMMQVLPPFFMRSHHLSPIEVGSFFGPVLAGGMILGMLAGGAIGNRIASRSVIDLIRFSTLAVFATVPLYAIALWVGSLTMALAVTFVATALSVIYSPNSTGAWQTLCHPRARGTAAGTAGFANAVLGGALFPFIVGALSDWWEPALGTESLRYAALASLIFCVFGALLFAWSVALIRRHPAEVPA